MSTVEFRTWNTRGRPYDVARPISMMVGFARSRGLAILGVIGNEAHLTSNNPQDHTPFSYTAWPIPLPGYVVTACDIEAGDWCWDFLARCKAGEFPWVKYINFMGKQYSVKNGWKATNNSDQHFHLSIRTDYINAWILNPFEPTPAPQKEDEEMSARLEWFAHCLEFGLEEYPDNQNVPADLRGREVQIIRKINALKTQLDEIQAALPEGE